MTSLLKRAFRSLWFSRWQKGGGIFILFLFLISPFVLIMISSQKKASVGDNYYHFKLSSFSGLYLGDLDLFQQKTTSEVEYFFAQLFPEHLRPHVQTNMRPILFLSQKYQVDPFWILSVIWTESHFKHRAVSNVGASGVMQIMPETFSELMEQMKKEGIFLEAQRGEDYLRWKYPHYTEGMLKKHSLSSRLENMEAGIFYLKKLLEIFEYDYHLATVAYNMGPNWTKNRLKNKLPVGVRNNYLSKVVKKYNSLMDRLDLTFEVAKITSPSPKVKTIINL